MVEVMRPVSQAETVGPPIADLKGKVKELLDTGQITCFIGYEKSTDGKHTRPAFIYRSGDVDRLVLDDTCVANLAKYLLNRKGKPTGLVVKPCASRAVNLLLSEHQIKREELLIIGITCNGVTSPPENEGKAGAYPACHDCSLRTPVIYDFLLGKPAEADNGADYGDVKEMEGKTSAERAAFWHEQFSRCIRCYACLDPEWVGIKIAPAENEMWHTIRAFHQAGRCVGCNACERVCPMKIPLSKLNRKLDKEVLRLFDFQSGLNRETPAPLTTFKKEEKLGVHV
jgi:formate dehydrogenase subunit beta